MENPVWCFALTGEMGACFGGRADDVELYWRCWCCRHLTLLKYFIFRKIDSMVLGNNNVGRSLRRLLLDAKLSYLTVAMYDQFRDWRKQRFQPSR